MDDVGMRIAQPAVEQLGAASGHIALSLGACRHGGHRVPEYLAPFEFVRPRCVGTGFGRSYEHLMATSAKVTRESGDVNLGAPEAVGVIPAHRLHDLHRHAL